MPLKVKGRRRRPLLLLLLQLRSCDNALLWKREGKKDFAILQNDCCCYDGSAEKMKINVLHCPRTLPYFIRSTSDRHKAKKKDPERKG